MLTSDFGNPEYIKWDEKGIYVITLAKKREFTPWEQIQTIKSYRVNFKGRYIEVYIVAKKKLLAAPYALEKNLGEKLYQEWLKHKEGWDYDR